VLCRPSNDYVYGPVRVVCRVPKHNFSAHADAHKDLSPVIEARNCARDARVYGGFQAHGGVLMRGLELLSRRTTHGHVPGVSRTPRGLYVQDDHLPFLAAAASDNEGEYHEHSQSEASPTHERCLRESLPHPLQEEPHSLSHSSKPHEQGIAYFSEGRDFFRIPIARTTVHTVGPG
jgi:hypothetical protein